MIPRPTDGKPRPPALVTSGVFGAESPSLAASGSPAYELKVLLSEAQARAVEERARRQLVSDPHTEAALGGAYLTTSLYCDTPRFDVFHRTAPHRRRKYRLRRYDHAAGVFLERKANWPSAWASAATRKRACASYSPNILPTSGCARP